ncbi:MAG: T9SS type A sorting domain-containing protein [Saprospiraceae bacterium]|nr:T9SS type A sorting domain-containing protein [Saprospiraceae bacterium]
MKSLVYILQPAFLFVLTLLGMNGQPAFAFEGPARRAHNGNPVVAESPTVLLGTITWTGAVSTDWHTAGNWSPATIPTSGSLSGDDVVIPVVGNGRYPEVTAMAFARSVSIAGGASLTVKSTGNLLVNASTTNGVTNAGMLTNQGTLKVDSSFSDGIVNQTGAMINNSGSLLVIEGTGSRLKNSGMVMNTGTFTVDGGLGIGLINYANATINNTGGTFKVQFGENIRVDNYGAINNSANFRIDGALKGAGLINRAGASVANTGGSFVVENGKDLRVDNYGSITNAATFTIAGASGGMNLINRAGAEVINSAGSFKIENGVDTRVDNYSKIDNYGMFTILGSGGGEALINRDTITNRAGATFLVESGKGRRLDNAGLFANYGTTDFGGGEIVNGNEGILNRQGATILNAAGALMKGNNYNKRFITNEGNLLSYGDLVMHNFAGDNGVLLNTATGVVDIQDSLHIEGYGGSVFGLVNHNQFTLGSNGKIVMPWGSGGRIQNHAVFTTAEGCIINAENSDSHLIFNETTGTFTNECAIFFNNGPESKIKNNGVYTHLKGNFAFSGGTRLLENNGYCRIDVPFTLFNGATTINPFMFLNTDSLILGDKCTFPPVSSGILIYDNKPGAYLYSDIAFDFVSNNGFGFPEFLRNRGKAILGPQSGLLAKGLGSANPIISNTDTLILQGDIEIRNFNAYAIGNTGYLEHSGTFRSANTGKVIQNNGGVFINSGRIQIDSVANHALLLEGTQTFTNTASGFISADFIIGNGIKNTGGSFINEGLVDIGLKDTIGLSGIENAGTFTNKNRIRIGGNGGEFGFHGILNKSGGLLHNMDSIVIGGPGLINGDAIVNESGAIFNNDPCQAELIIASNNVINNAGTFNNDGRIVENASGNSSISSNTGLVQNLNGGNFTINSGAPAITVSGDFSACAEVSGDISWSTFPTFGVKDALVSVTGAFSFSDLTDVNGDYQVNPVSTNCTVTPTKTINKFNGVTAADAARIQQHIAGNAPLGAPFPRIAADVNKSNSITTIDAGLITQALLGNPTANNIWNTSWRFVPDSHTFPNPNAPWGFPENVVLTGVTTPTTVNFTGVKLGDVTAPLADPSMRPEAVVLRCPDRPLAINAGVEVPVSVEGFRDIAAFQFVLHFDTDALAFEGITTPDGGLLRPEQFGAYNLENGELRAVYAQAEGSDLESGSAFFTLHFRAKTGGAMVSDLLRLNEDLLPAEAYTPEMFIKPVQLIFGQTTSSVEPAAGMPTLFAQPNPTRDRTNLHFSLPAGGEAVIRVTDMSGRLIVSQKANYAVGVYMLPVEFSKPGLYVAELRTAYGVQVVKVVVE